MIRIVSVSVMSMIGIISMISINSTMRIISIISMIARIRKINRIIIMNVIPKSIIQSLSSLRHSPSLLNYLRYARVTYIVIMIMTTIVNMIMIIVITIEITILIKMFLKTLYICKISFSHKFSEMCNVCSSLTWWEAWSP